MCSVANKYAPRMRGGVKVLFHPQLGFWKSDEDSEGMTKGQSHSHTYRKAGARWVV